MSLRCPLIVVFAIAAIAGCGDIPRSRIPELPAVSDDVVTDEGRGGYNWDLFQGSFPVVRHFDFPFLEKVDRVKLAANLASRKQMQLKAPRKIEGLGDELYQRMLHFREPQPEAASARMSLKRSAEVGTHHFAINFDGDRLVTVGSKVILWDIARQARLKEYDSPCSMVLRVTIDPTCESIALCDDSNVYRLSLEDGRVDTWQLSAGKIKDFVAARDKKQYALLTDGGAMVHLDESFKATSLTPRGRMHFDQIAIHPSGGRIIAGSTNQLYSWPCNDRQELDLLRTFDSFSRPSAGRSIPLAGTIFDRLVYENEVLEHSVARARQASGPQLQQQRPRLLHRSVLDAFAATNDRSDDWFVIGFEQLTPAGTKEYAVCDVSLDDDVSSAPFVIAPRRPVTLRVNGNASVLAAEDPDGTLRVIHRPQWMDPTGRKIALDVARLACGGKFEQAEACATWLRELPDRPGGPSGEELYSLVAQTISQNLNSTAEWGGPEALESAVSRTEPWRSGTSELGRLSKGYESLLRLESSYSVAVFSSFRPSPSDEVTQSTLAMLTKMATAAEPSSAALTLVSPLRNAMKLDPYELEAALARFTEAHPDDIRPHAEMCNEYVLERSGEIGQPGAYLSALSELFPKDERDIVYARGAIHALRRSRSWGTGPERGFDILRIIAGSEKMLANQNATADELAMFLEVAMQYQKKEWAEALSNYYQAHFTLPCKLLHERVGADEHARFLRGSPSP